VNSDAGVRDAAFEPEKIVDLVKRALKYGLLGTTAGLAQAATRLDMILDSSLSGSARSALLQSLREITRAARETLERLSGKDDETRYVWEIIDLVVAILTGIVRHGIVTHPHGLDAINDYECREWLKLNGASESSVNSGFVRGLFDLAMAYPGGDTERPALAAGQAVRGALRMFFTYRGALFWKMRAGMGDVVFAPLYQALIARGVEFEFFHRVDALHLDDRRQAVEAIAMGRQARLADGVKEYHPLSQVGGLPVFPDRPLAEQLVEHARGDLESHFGERADVETRVLRKGVDFDHVVLAASLGMVELVAGELIADSPQWRDMTTHLRTVATQAFQLWLRPDEPTLGWPRPGVTTSGYLAPFDTWASMPQTLWAEQWPEHDRPGTVAYFCGALNALWPNTEDADAYVAGCREKVLTEAVAYLDNHVGLYLPGAVTEQGFAWHLLVGANGHSGASALETQYVSVNIDPSDRYVQSVPGSDKYRLRSDESGYDNLVLAGDWTDSGYNAGCIEAAVMSGLQAANALLGRGRLYRIRGFYLP
jgi:uncharacterized protein with NAD-binding domain and iron-sulfur cluster